MSAWNPSYSYVYPIDEEGDYLVDLRKYSRLMMASVAEKNVDERRAMTYVLTYRRDTPKVARFEDLKIFHGQVMPEWEYDNAVDAKGRLASPRMPAWDNEMPPSDEDMMSDKDNDEDVVLDKKVGSNTISKKKYRKIDAGSNANANIDATTNVEANTNAGVNANTTANVDVKAIANADAEVKTNANATTHADDDADVNVHAKTDVTSTSVSSCTSSPIPPYEWDFVKERADERRIVQQTLQLEEAGRVCIFFTGKTDFCDLPRYIKSCGKCGSALCRVSSSVLEQLLTKVCENLAEVIVAKIDKMEELKGIILVKPISARWLFWKEVFERHPKFYNKILRCFTPGINIPLILKDKGWAEYTLAIVTIMCDIILLGAIMTVKVPPVDPASLIYCTMQQPGWTDIGPGIFGLELDAVPIGGRIEKMIKAKPKVIVRKMVLADDEWAADAFPIADAEARRAAAAGISGGGSRGGA